MASRSQVLAAARRKFGAKAYLEERRNAQTASERQRDIDRRREINQRKAALAELEKTDPPNHPALLKACHFVVDVDGDNPSIPQLKVELERAQRCQDRMEERRALHEEALGLGGYSYRWECLVGHGWANQVVASADTLDELLAKIEATSSVLLL